MPHIHILAAPGTAQRRLLDTTLASLAKKGYKDIRRREGGDWASLLTENRCAGLFDEKTAVVVEDTEKLGAFPAHLAPLMEPDGADSVILLLCKTENQTPIPKDLLPRCSLAKATEPSPWSKERDEMIRDAAKRKDVAVSYDAVILLKELFEDTGELVAETDKLAERCRSGTKKEISIQDVEAFCLSDGSKSLLKLLDGMCTRKHAECLKSMEALAQNADLLPLLSALHNRIRLALYSALYPTEKQAFAKALGARDYALRQAETAAKLYGAEKLQTFVTGLIRINSNEKSGLGASWRDLGILLIDLMS